MLVCFFAYYFSLFQFNLFRIFQYKISFPPPTNYKMDGRNIKKHGIFLSPPNSVILLLAIFFPSFVTPDLKRYIMLRRGDTSI